MKSSSQLFPVEIVSADVRGQIFQDLYSLKPNKSEDKSVEIALLHLHMNKDASAQKQVLFIHDVFHSHWQWMDDGPAQKLIDRLLEQGYSVWLMDWRAHGSSKKNRMPYLNTINEMAQCDLTSVIDFIEEKSRQQLNLIAKGFGAQMSLMAMPELKNVRQYFLIDAQSTLPSRLFWLPGVRLVRWLKLIGKTWIFGLGDEPEPATLFRTYLKDGGWFALFRRSQSKYDAKFYQSIAAKIVWLCTSSKYESKAKRLTRKQSRINRVPANQVLDELYDLITSQSI